MTATTTTQTPMDAATRTMVLGWLEQAGGDVERVARWMRSTLNIGGLRDCRALVHAAMEVTA